MGKKRKKEKKGIILHITKEGAKLRSKGEQTVKESLNGIWGTSIENVYAVGDNGLVLHYDGEDEDWSEMMPKPTSNEEENPNLCGIWMSSNPHLFVVGEDGFIGNQDFAAIKGKICDSCDGEGIDQAEIQRWNTQSEEWETWGDSLTNPSGDFDYTDRDWQLSPGVNRLKFRHGNYFEEAIDVDVPSDYWFDIYSYLLPNVDYERCISGVISEIYTIGGKEFSQVLKGVQVKLKKKSCSGWSPTGYNDQITLDGGHYNYTIKSGENGTYKVVPTKSGYTFNPEYDNVEIVIPQNENTIKSYDFTGVQ
ncbi:MAG: hypothetical protein JRI87_07615 [Deltaproteobacteria bacterium]|nr:hypothetical protein [Deltaproteobacteria bacterium]